mgnify:CR=1 FL=1
MTRKRDGCALSKVSSVFDTLSIKLSCEYMKPLFDALYEYAIFMLLTQIFIILQSNLNYTQVVATMCGGSVHGSYGVIFQ